MIAEAINCRFRKMEPQSLDNCTGWHLLALSDPELERADIVVLNLAVARGISSLAGLDMARYVDVVHQWTQRFKAALPRMETKFHTTPGNWKNDIRFFRIGMLQGFLGHVIGIGYNEEQMHAEAVRYVNPSDLFLNGLIDTKQGTCGNMAALHVAISRRMGWPVSLACAGPHLVSRFDDGEVTYNIEATSTHPGSFCCEPDETYTKRFQLPKRAIECGSDLRKLSAREMLAVFLSLRGRHYSDTNQPDSAAADYSLAQAVFPQYRRAFIAMMALMLRRGARIFERGELGHPDSLFNDFVPVIARHPGTWYMPVMITTPHDTAHSALNPARAPLLHQ